MDFPSRLGNPCLGQHPVFVVVSPCTTSAGLSEIGSVAKHLFLFDREISFSYKHVPNTVHGGGLLHIPVDGLKQCQL